MRLLILMSFLAQVPLGLGLAQDPTPPAPAGDDRPDVLYLIVDDLGWHDVGFTGGGSHPTPRIDALASTSTVFEHAYADAPNCAPTRASILSGQATARHGVLTVGSSRRGKKELRRVEPVPNQRFLDEDVPTLADDLQKHGYRTVHVGKFHAGPDPLDYGFTDQVAGTSLGHPKSYRSPYRNPRLEDGPEGEYLTDRLVQEATGFIESDDERPLFLHMSFYSVHTPIQPRADLFEASAARLPDQRVKDQKYDAMVAAVDAAVGRILDAFSTRTRPLMIIFTSDNGGYGPLADNGPLRGSKGMLYEGGIRVPLAIRWPGSIEAGRSSSPVLLRDLVPTILEVAGSEPAERILDGRSLAGIRDGDVLEAVPLHWHFPVYLERDSSVTGPWRTTPVAACRLGRFKLMEFFETGDLELYDLASDPSEKRNLIEEFPSVAERLHSEMTSWRTKVGAGLPTPVPTEPIEQEPSRSSTPSLPDQST